jgi:1,4-alpha-glucan branching enzyme
MGQEYGAATPFQFFCAFDEKLGAAVARGRREEFARFAGFASAAERERIPDPNDPATFARSRLDWSELEAPEHADWHGYHSALLELRRRHIVPLLPRLPGGTGTRRLFSDSAFEVVWRSERGERLTLAANVGETQVATSSAAPGELIYALPEGAPQGKTLEPWSMRLHLDTP